MTGDDVRLAAGACVSALRTSVDRDWADVAVPGLDFTVESVVAHAAGTVAWYAIDLAAGRRQHEALHPTVEPGSSPAELLVAVEVAAAVCAAVIDAAPSGARGFHPFGWADASGFAAMSCDELLVHTDDACRALGVTFEPPEPLVLAVLGRLFPWEERRPGEGPWALLRWANGRTELPGRPPPAARWLWWSAPLDEWDGRRPEAPPDLGAGDQ